MIELRIWFTNGEALLTFLDAFQKLESGIHADVYSAQSYKTVEIKGVAILTHEQGQIRFNLVAGKHGQDGITLGTAGVLRFEIQLLDKEDE